MGMFRVALVPRPDTNQDLADLLQFLGHYLAGLDFTFVVPSASGKLEQPHWRVSGEGLGNVVESVLQHVSFESENAFAKTLSDYDYVFVTKPWNHIGSRWAQWLRGVKPNRLIPVDWRESPGVESRLTSLAGDLRGLEMPKASGEALRSKIRRLRETIGQSVLVGTGPSGRKVLDFDVTDRIAIVCNTIFLDQELMNHLRPEFLVFSDPAYHLGPSEYSKEFRNQLVTAAELFPEFDVVTLRKHHEPLAKMVPSLTNRIYSVEQGGSRKSSLNLDLDIAPIVRPYPNILTLLMLPLAASLSRSIELFGFDGRKKTDAMYWSHGTSVQLNDLLASHQTFHSGFHSIQFQDYFTEHSEQLEEVLSAVERKGLVVTSMTPSTIPALEKRDPAVNSSRKLASSSILSVSPGWTSAFGHYEPWNTALHAAASMRGLQYKALAHRKASGPLPEWAVPCLAEQAGIAELNAGSFPSKRKSAEELKRLIEKEMRTMPGPITVFIYEATQRDIGIWREVAGKFPELKFVCNVMWDAGGPQSQPVGKENLDTPSNLFFSGDNDMIVAELHRAIPAMRRLPFFAPAAAKIPGPTHVRPRKPPWRILWAAKPFQARGSGELIPFAEGLRDLVAVGEVELVWRIPPTGPAIPLLGDTQKIMRRLGVQVIRDLANRDPESYQEFLQSFDLIVLPYPDHRRTSGLAVDALCSGTPVLTFEGNWISELGLSREEIIAVPDSPESLARAVRHLVETDAQVGAGTGEIVELQQRFDVDKTLDFLVAPEIHPCAVGEHAINALGEWDSRRRIRLGQPANSGNWNQGLLPQVDTAYSYAEEFHMDEAKLVRKMLTDEAGPGTLFSIVDIGAANGSFFQVFGDLFSEVWAVEPHPLRAGDLAEKYSSDERVHVIQAAISNDRTGMATLYDSEESWGVSTLNPWLDSHTPAHVVAMMTLSDLNLPPVVDILKVDAEGHDLSVLESLDWEKHDVGLVIAEFDDRKLGEGEKESWAPIVAFLEQRGFLIIISEWYPIEVYGRKHRWRQLHVGTTPLPGAWGNIIGVRRPGPSNTTILRAVLESLSGSEKLPPSITVSNLQDWIGKSSLAHHETPMGTVQNFGLSIIEYWLRRASPPIYHLLKKSRKLTKFVRKLKRLDWKK